MAKNLTGPSCDEGRRSLGNPKLAASALFPTLRKVPRTHRAGESLVGLDLSVFCFLI